MLYTSSCNIFNDYESLFVILTELLNLFQSVEPCVSIIRYTLSNFGKCFYHKNMKKSLSFYYLFDLLVCEKF